MIQKKVCMLGAFAVGKTSLVAQYVHSVFSEKYLTTIGVKIDRKELTVDNQAMSLMLWDIHGEDEFQKVRASYLRGTAGYFLVVDPTRPNTLATAIQLQELAHSAIGDRPFVVLLNKSDVESEWKIDPKEYAALEAKGWSLRKTSAKDDSNVEESMSELAKLILAADKSAKS